MVAAREGEETLDTEDKSQSQCQPSSSHISSESYPVAAPLVTILRRVVQLDEERKRKEAGSQNDHKDEGKEDSSSELIIDFVRESVEDALQNLIRNCFVAMDEMYFYTQPSQRNKPSFQHRLCIRISVCAEAKTLSITDLGSGMTRSDLINSLGVGSRLGPEFITAVRYLDTYTGGFGSNRGDLLDIDEEERDGGSDSVYDSDSDESSVDEDDNEGEEDKSYFSNTASKNMRSSGEKKIVVPCKSQDIGGFYSAFCTLATKIEIGTKSKFDDYYVFQLSKDDSFSSFKIMRPMEEGAIPTVLNGYDKFTDVRGESGTRITIHLNQDAIAAGILDSSEKFLKPLLTKFLESSPYSVVLEDCCEDNERMDIIDASQKEMDEIKKSKSEVKSDEDVLLDAVTDTFNDSRDEDGKMTDLYNSVKERSKYIPLRLSMGERKMLRLVEASMSCCDYTTDVDKKFKSATRRTHCQFKKIHSVLRGMVSSCDYNAGKKLLSSEDEEGSSFSDYKTSFQQMFEIARRHKIMNPEKMRSEYGKLIYLLQDAASPSIQPHLSFSCKGPIETVYKFLEERGGLGVLEDKFIDVATREVLAEKKSRAQINNEIKRKEKAVAHIKQKYRSSSLSSEDIHLCLYSICDNDSFLNSNRVPVDKVIGYLQHFFSPGKIEEGYSLSIVSGEDGSRLSHSHDRQYFFALQSLTLWRDIIDDMFRLWAMAEEDLLSDSITYSLKDTGQGMQRVQQCPKTYKSMQKILARVQGKVTQWIGSNVIHLGDHNVPNALTFIDKYVQVPRILSPIVTCLENIERICEEDDGIENFIETGFGGVEQLKKDILYDFFKSAFDGSGADNFYDAGSCIDGRLTSAWNWCSQLPNKPFYCVFKLTGFTGFDGEFK